MWSTICSEEFGDFSFIFMSIRICFHFLCTLIHFMNKNNSKFIFSFVYDEPLVLMLAFEGTPKKLLR